MSDGYRIGCVECGGEIAVSRYTVERGWRHYCRKHKGGNGQGKSYDAKFSELVKQWTPKAGKG